MAFKITARTLLHLGAELISSDAVALYELIKNAFDANSLKGVQVGVTVRLPSWPGAWPMQIAKLPPEPPKDSSKHPAFISELENLKRSILEALDATAPGFEACAAGIRAAQNADSLRVAAEAANEIVIRDTGHGMSKADLNDVYLTIGTRYRRKEREAIALSGHELERPILGEKGLGRLAVMRLGQRVRVETTQAQESHWNVLEIDWSRFSHDSDELVGDVKIEPQNGPYKDGPDVHGTVIIVRALNANWTKHRLKSFANVEAAKFNSPFEPEKRYRIILRYNGEVIPLLDFDRMILNNCHAYASAEFGIESEGPCLRGRVDYRQQKKERAFVLSGATLLSASNVTSLEVLRSLGPFTMEVFWFNRRLLQKKEISGHSIGEIINLWSGGLMVFRDGFRVLPYGDEGDDWLHMDPKAYASSGFKVNRKQIIGRVSISVLQNPALTDQTNREGLRETPEKQALVNLLRHVLDDELRQFLNVVDNEERTRLRLSFDEVGERLAKEKQSLRKNLTELRKRRSETPEEQLIFKEIDETVDCLENMMEEAQALADEFERGRSQVIHLAGLGLMVEFLAHELNRATQHALGTLADGRGADRALTSSAMQNLELQLKTLQKRLSSLDPTTTSGRNRKQAFDIAVLAQQVLDGHAGEFQRHGISAAPVRVLPSAKAVEVKMVKGMLIQVLENLLSNSIYWLKQQQRVERDFAPEIIVEVDAGERALRVTDNGPGVSEEDAEHLFTPFFTRKPPGEGKGLGLYISREIAHYHQATLELSDERRFRATKRNTFILTLPK
jgi:signal transduction histidine kinase